MKEKLKLFVWSGSGVLTDWTDGMVCVLAEDLGKAIKLIKKKNPMCIKCIEDINSYKVIKKPEAFICWGGS